MAKLSDTTGKKEKEPYPVNTKEGKKEDADAQQEKIDKKKQCTK